MKFHKTKIKGVFIIEPELKKDKRGYFFRAFCKNEIMKSLRIDFNVAQINRSLTRKKGTIRGLHYQKSPHREDKIVQCLRGEIYVVVLDLRKNSPGFGKWVSSIISEKNKKMLLVPKGCTVGIQTLTNDCEMLYYMSEYYSPEYYSGIRWDDPFFKIKWPIKNPFISEKDKTWEYFVSEKSGRNRKVNLFKVED